jgi:DNA-binding Xre family transcriptional regulator
MSDARGEDVSPEASQRICTHMNEDHAATVIGMAQSTLNWKEGKIRKVTFAKLTKVTLLECSLSFALCHKDVCEVHARSVPFIPPLQSAHELR